MVVGIVLRNMENKTISELAAYVRNNMEDYEPRQSLALKVIGRDRCGLKQSTPMLYNEIVDAICEWCDNNGVDCGDWDMDDVIEGDRGIIWEE